jgi:hypothetical protein
MRIQVIVIFSLLIIFGSAIPSPKLKSHLPFNLKRDAPTFPDPYHERFNLESNGNQTWNGQVSSYTYIPAFDFQTPVEINDVIFSLDVTNQVFVTFDGHALIHYRSNGTYVQFVFEGENATCWYINRTYENEISNTFLAGQTWVGSSSVPGLGLVDRYLGLIHDNAYGNQFYASVATTKNGVWRRWETQSPFLARGINPEDPEFPFYVIAIANYEFQQVSNQVANATFFQLPAECLNNPVFEGYEERYLPPLSQTVYPFF